MPIKKELNHGSRWSMRATKSIPIPVTPKARVSIEQSGEAEEMRVKTLKMLSLMKGSPASRFIAETEPEFKSATTITEDAEYH